MNKHQDIFVRYLIVIILIEIKTGFLKKEVFCKRTHL